ncbi:MAG TPA: Ig-like domain-containing protein [Pyrinomonadaceae bacterium]|nr:Ig-like domain-containing protein [Pyrinomonadaceae bacterium]
MKSPLSNSLRQAMLLVLLVVVALFLGRQSSNRVVLKATPASGSATTENPSDPNSSGKTTLAVTPPGEAQSRVDGSSATRAPLQSTASSAALVKPESEKQVVTSENTEVKHNVQERDEHTKHFAASDPDRGEQGGEAEEEERKQDQPDEAMKWRMGSLVDETGTIPPNAEISAWLQAKEMPVDVSAWPTGQLNPTDPVAAINPTGWQWLGPGNIGGRVRSIIIHPNDSQTIWLGSVSGGIWKTTNGGASWAPLADFMANLAVSSMVIDPTDPNILYAGTGEGYFNGDSIRGAGVFKSTDGGATWNQLPQTAATPNWYYVDRLAISPADHQIILAATRSGIWRSADGGTTWSRRTTTSFMFDVNFHPTDGNLAIAAGDNGVARYSLDGGVTWNPATGITGSRVEVAYSRSSPNIVYASVENGQGQVYKSTDGGQTYSLINGTSSHLNDQGWYDNAIWVDPTNPNNVVVGGITLYRSTNGGANFAQIGSVHADQHIIIEAPGFDGVANKTVYFGNDGGIFQTKDINAGFVVTQELNNNLGITQFYSGVGNVSSGNIIGGTQDNGTLRYTGNTETWNFMAGGDGGWTAADQTNPNYFYGEFQWLQLHRSINGGASSQSIYEGITDAVPNGNTNFIAPFVLDPNNPNTLLAGGATLWRTTNAKGFLPLGWTAIKSSIGSNISASAVAPGNSDIVWVGHNNGNIFVTTNGTAATPTWTQVNMPATGRRNTRITIDPTNSNRVYVTFGGYAVGNVWRTDNAGASFVNITNNLPIAPVRSLVVWQNNPNFLYVGTEVGVFASANGGQTWSPSNDGPTNCSVDELFWMGNTLVAATHGRGMFSINLSTGQPPSVSLTSPANGAGFNGGAQVTIAADASDADGTVTKVDFFANNTLIGTATTAPYSVVWNNVPVGTHVLMARVADNSGDTALSSAININVSWAVCTGTPISLGQTINGSHAETDCAAPIGNRNDSYLFDANAGEPIAITMTAGFFDTRLILMDPNGAVIASDDNGNGGTDSRIPAGSGFMTLPSSGTYTIVATSAVVGLVAGGPYALTLVGGPTPSSVQFSSAGYSTSESGGAFNVNVMRMGSTGSATTVNYRTADTAGLDNCSVLNGNASARCDYTTVVGTLRFDVGQTSKSISIPIVDDSYAEATESFSIVLSDVTGGSLGATVTAILTINDNEVTNGPNPVDVTPFFVLQQYLDFLNREPDPGGFAAWQQVISNCPVGDTTCDRIHVSSAFFRSPEFQDRGYFIYRFYPVSFGRKPEYVEFVPDLAKVSGFLSDAELEAAKVAFITEFMSRPAFVTKFNGLNNTEYVDLLLSTAGITHPARDFWIAALGDGTRTRAQVLREIAESTEVYNKYYNQAFVVMQYFGYLRRDPDAFYLDWIQVLNSSGDFRGMVNGFMNSLEYRFRFGP